MKTKTSKKVVWIKSLILLPLIAVLMYSFSEKKIIKKETPKKAIQGQFYKVNKENYVENSTQDTNVPNIFVTINKNKDILINRENYTTIESLKNEIDRILKDYTPNQISSVKVIIEADESLKMDVIFEIESKIREAGNLKRELKLVDATYEQENATPEELVEYNKLATIYNNQPQDKRIVKLKDLNRLEYLFNKMTVKQREDAEPFPDCPPPPTKSQYKATKEQIAEYNKLAQHYNNMSQNNMIIRLEDMKSMHYIYDLMTKKQKKDAQPFPNFTPPPPTKVGDKVIEGNHLPPPPPIPADASPEQKEKYNKAIANYERHIGYTYKTESGEVIQVIKEATPLVQEELVPPPPPPTMNQETVKKGSKELQEVFIKLSEQSKLYAEAVRKYRTDKKGLNGIENQYKKVLELNQEYSDLAIEEGFSPTPPPPPTPTPRNPTDHMIEMAKQGSLFYYEDKKISSDKAIEISKKNKNVNIQVLGDGSSKPVVKLTTNPINNRD